MNRQEFLATLKAELSFLPLDERVNAVKYYEEYFEDAGEENETAILLELGQPKQVAEKILENLGYQKNGIFKSQAGNIELKIIDSVESLEDEQVFNKDYGFNIEKEKEKSPNTSTPSAADKNENIHESANSEMELVEIEEEHIKREPETKEYRYETRQQTGKDNSDSKFQQYPPQKNKTANVALIVILLVFASPIWIPLLSAAFVTVLSLFVALLSVAVTFMGVAFTGAALVVTGVGLLAYAAAALFTSLFVAASSAGVGFLCIGGGVILGYVFFRAGIFLFKIMFKITAKLLSGIVNAIRGLFVKQNYNAA